MATDVNIRSGNGLLPNGTKPLPKPLLTNKREILRHSTEGSRQSGTKPKLVAFL